MKTRKLLVPLLGVASIVGVVTPLVACSKEQGEEKKEEVTIAFGALNGYIMGDKEIKVKAGTKWSDVNLPKVEPYEGDATTNYVLAGWFSGNKIMTNDDVVENDMYITARFIVQNKYADPDIWETQVVDEGFARIVAYKGGNNFQFLALPEYDSEGNLIMDVYVGSLPTVQTLYVSKYVEQIRMDVYTDNPTLLSIIVDKENQYLTSQDDNGKECNCVFDRKRENNPYRSLWAGTRGSIIPEGITNINDNAFKCSLVKNITLPSTLVAIHANAFARCHDLEEITIPSNVQELGTKDIESSVASYGHVFYECINLKSITFLGTKIQDIYSFTFDECRSLESIVIPEGVKYIGDYCFVSCYNLKSVSLPSTLEYIEDPSNQFFESIKMESFVVNNKNQHYSSGSNDNCLMEKVDDDWVLVQGFACSTIPTNCTKLGPGCFWEQPIKSVHFPASVKEIQPYDSYGVFHNCDQLSEVTFDPECKIDEIPDQTFIGCKSLKKISLPSTIQMINQKAFEGSGLEEINKLENLKYISQSAFKNTYLKTFYIPKSIVAIGDQAFGGGFIKNLEFGGSKDEFIEKIPNVFLAFDGETEPSIVTCSDGKLDLSHVPIDFHIDQDPVWNVENQTFDLWNILGVSWFKPRTDIPKREEFIWEITSGSNKVKWDETLPGRLINVSGGVGDTIGVKVSLAIVPSIFVTTSISLETIDP